MPKRDKRKFYVTVSYVSMEEYRKQDPLGADVMQRARDKFFKKCLGIDVEKEERDRWERLRISCS